MGCGAENETKLVRILILGVLFFTGCFKGAQPKAIEYAEQKYKECQKECEVLGRDVQEADHWLAGCLCKLVKDSK